MRVRAIGPWRPRQPSSSMTGAAFDAWLASLEARHLAELRFSEVTRAVRALSTIYVEQRERLSRGAALDA
ncbi:MAG: hypothetical protein ACT4QD_24050, partial [Acidobacteriota bacterium]